KLPARPFTPPTSPSASPSATGAALDAPPSLELPANSKDLNVAIVGLNPVDKLGPMPQASSPAAFSSGPVPRRDGATAEGTGKGLTVPDLFVRAPRDLKSEMLAQAYAAPTSSETLRAVINRSQADQPARIVGAPGNGIPDSGAAKVSTAPDPRFNGRDVYLMAIQMPNLTSYSGSWLMWYADRTLRQAGLAPISPPVAHRKVDPKYIASAVAERIEGRVTLGCVIDREGKVSRVELIHGIDERLNQSAEEALSKWEFYPATRKGAPVDVDVVVEIPFRLEPRIPRR
ncbi:MAG TPA: energy transducer TonB, partial [Bryobacteraceae bacterium]|nr:energy transducer TonB [Bryobacteraceae bacterium]